MNYSRQEKLNLNIPNSVTIIGVGGIGNWTALFFALVGVKEIVLIDPDIVEDHNLNRTIFREQDIHKDKVLALSEIIFERRKDTVVSSFSKKFEDLNEIEAEKAYSELIVDCRDNLEDIDFDIDVILRYDGLNTELTFNPNFSEYWGKGPTTYTVEPSYLCSPVYVANLLVRLVTNDIYKTDLNIIKDVSEIGESEVQNEKQT